MTFSAFLRAAGCAIASSAIIGNKWVAGAWRDVPLNYADVMQTYMVTALVAGGLLVLCGFLVEAKPRVSNAALLLFMVVGIVLMDRVLLAYWGLPHWVPDTELHYRHRPSTSRINIAHNARAQNKRIDINRHGFHDDEFPLEKPLEEIRILFLGDSVTMGWGVERRNTYANQMEHFLRAAGARIQCINAGVEGYATHQELQVLRESLPFAPDRVVLGFVMNDVLGPAEQDKRHGGSGSFWGLLQSNSAALGYLSNETGVGRTIQKMRQRQYEKAGGERTDFAESDFFSAPLSDPLFADKWQSTLEQIREINELCQLHEIPFTLVVFPEKFQLFRRDRQAPQKILNDFAKERDIALVDLTPYFERLLAPLIGGVFSPRSSPENVRLYRNRSDVMATAFFLDDVHLSAEGHKIVGILLAELYGADVLGGNSEALMPVLRKAAAMQIEPHVVMPKSVELALLSGEALVEMGYVESACQFYKSALERFTGDEHEIEKRLRQQGCANWP